MSTTYDAGECDACRRPVIFATYNGKQVEVEADADPNFGTISLHRFTKGITASSVHPSKAAAVRAAGVPLYRLHAGSCSHSHSRTRR